MKEISFPRGVLMAFIILSIIAAILTLLGHFSISGYSFIIPLFYFTVFEHMNPQKYWHLVLGGVVGLTLGFALSFIALLGPYSTIAMAVYAVIMILAISCQVRRKLELVLNNLTWLILTPITLIPGGVNLANEAGPYGNIIGVYAGFIIVCVVLGIACLVIASSAKKKAQTSAQA